MPQFLEIIGLTWNILANLLFHNGAFGDRVGLNTHPVRRLAYVDLWLLTFEVPYDIVGTAHATYATFSTEHH